MLFTGSPLPGTIRGDDDGNKVALPGTARLRCCRAGYHAFFGVDLTCPGFEYSWFREAGMEYIGLGALLALWRYFFDVDWDLRMRRRKRRKPGV